jgi:hypothetical protein
MTASFEKLLDRYRMLLAAQRQATAAGAAAAEG